MSFVMKEVLYNAILNDYGTSDQDDDSIDLENASLNEVKRLTR